MRAEQSETDCRRQPEGRACESNGKLSWRFALHGRKGRSEYILLTGLLYKDDINKHMFHRFIDARHVAAFLADNASAREGFVICRCTRPQLLCPGVTALPWQNL